jgi:hypothetical protein
MNDSLTIITSHENHTRRTIQRLWETMKSQDRTLDGSPFGLRSLIDAKPDQPLEQLADTLFGGLTDAFDHYNRTVETCRQLKGNVDKAALEKRCIDAHNQISLYVHDQGFALEGEQHFSEKEARQFMGKIIRAAIDSYRLATSKTMGVPDDAMDYPPYGLR